VLNPVPGKMFAMNLRGCVGWTGFFAHAEKDGRGTQAHPTDYVIYCNHWLKIKVR